MSVELLRVRNVTKRYSIKRGCREVLNGVELTVSSGEFVSLLGPSGAGKTTLLRIISGLEAPTEGTVQFGDGVSVDSIATVFQRSLLFPWRTVLRNAAFGLECSGTAKDKAEALAIDMLNKIGMGDHLQSFPHQISGGMKQRVDIARALLTKPKILLMDEPFASLDIATARQLHDLLLSLWETEQVAVVFVSHQLSEVAYLSDRVLFMSGYTGTVTKSMNVEIPRPRGVGTYGRIALVREEERLRDWYY